MKRAATCVLVWFLLSAGLSAVIPFHFGARSLALGYGGSAYTYDINAMFFNPAILAQVGYSITGYQYQHSYFDYATFATQLEDVLSDNPADYESLDNAAKEQMFDRLNDLFTSKQGLYGFDCKLPGALVKGYGFSVSFINTAVAHPKASSLFQKNPLDVTNDDIAGLDFEFIGLRYTQITLSYGMALAKNISLGIGLHYMFGNAGRFESPLTGTLFNADMKVKDYLEYAWDAAATSFKKMNVDLALSTDIGAFFKVAVIAKNVGSPSIETGAGPIELETRYIGALAFRPNNQWGIYLDVDVTRTDLYLNGVDRQPFSLGVEKGFFSNKFFLRAGLLSDLSDSYVIGSRSNALYGLGMGFNMHNIVVDIAAGMDGEGSITNLAISGFFIF